MYSTTTDLTGKTCHYCGRKLQRIIFETVEIQLILEILVNQFYAHSKCKPTDHSIWNAIINLAWKIMQNIKGMTLSTLLYAFTDEVILGNFIWMSVQSPRSVINNTVYTADKLGFFFTVKQNWQVLSNDDVSHHLNFPTSLFEKGYQPTLWSTGSAEQTTR